MNAKAKRIKESLDDLNKRFSAIAETHVWSASAPLGHMAPVAKEFARRRRALESALKRAQNE